MSKTKKCDVLLVGQTPPPFHGQAVVTAMLFEQSWDEFELEVETLRMAYSESIDSVGKASLAKIGHLFALVWQTWKVALLRRPEALYYLPASANRVPVMRDVIYLALVRWCFSKKVFHYHAGGLPEYLVGAGLVGKLGRWAYRDAEVSIEICQTQVPPWQAFHAKRQAIVPNGLDVNLMPRERAPGKPVRILFVGGLSEGKGVLEILKTARELRSRGKAFEIVIVGDWVSDGFRDEALEYLDEHDLDTVVTFAGVLKGDDKWQAYADSDVFFFPSHYQAENFPLVLIEAMAFGLPLVSTDWRGIPQLVGDSGCATLCEVRCPPQFADALEPLIDQSEQREQRGKLARAEYERRFTRQRFVESIAEIFREVGRKNNDLVG